MDKKEKVRQILIWQKLQLPNVFNSIMIIYISSTGVWNSVGNSILNTGGNHDQIIPLSTVIEIGRQRKLQFRSSKTAFPAIFHNILLKKYCIFFLLNSTRWHWKYHLSLNVFLVQVEVKIFHRTGISMLTCVKKN